MRDHSQKKPTLDERRIDSTQKLPAEVRLVQIAGDGTDTNSVMTGAQAWALAQNSDLDLVLIVADSKPPVVRLCDYGKFRFAELKHERELTKTNRANARTVKTLRINQAIGPADYSRDLSQIREWLPRHDVKLEVIMRGFKGRGNRTALPRGMDQGDAPRWPDFILNRVLRDLGPSVRSDRMNVGDKGITAMVRPA